MPERYSTDAVTPVERFAYWREVICAVFVELDAAPIVGQERERFAGSVDTESWGDVRMSTVVSEPQVVTRRPHDERSDCLVSIQLTGTGRITQAGRTAVLGPGDFAMYDAQRPYELAFDDPLSQIVVQVPRDSVIARNLHVETAVARRCDGQRGLGAIASSLVRNLSEQSDSIDPRLRPSLGGQALDCLMTALAHAHGGSTTPEAIRSVDRQRVLRWVDAQLADPGLSVASVAAAFGVSTRTIQKLFEDDECRLGERIRRARLERARAALADPRRRHHAISAIE